MKYQSWREGQATVARKLGCKWATVNKWCRPGSKVMPTWHYRMKLYDLVFLNNGRKYKQFRESMNNEWQGQCAGTNQRTDLKP